LTPKWRKMAIVCLRALRIMKRGIKIRAPIIKRKKKIGYRIELMGTTSPSESA
jgi:hypothetical protein